MMTVYNSQSRIKFIASALLLLIHCYFCCYSFSEQGKYNIKGVWCFVNLMMFI